MGLARASSPSGVAEWPVGRSVGRSPLFHFLAASADRWIRAGRKPAGARAERDGDVRVSGEDSGDGGDSGAKTRARDSSARLECYRCADTTNQWWGVCATRRRRAL